MPFRLSIAPASFQDDINKILAKKLDIFVFVYPDDIFIYTENLGKDHVKAVKRVLNVFKKHRLFANLKRY